MLLICVTCCACEAGCARETGAAGGPCASNVYVIKSNTPASTLKLLIFNVSEQFRAPAWN